MIISKPKLSTLVSLGLFLMIAYGLGAWSILSLPKETPTPFYRYVLSAVILLVAITVTVKVLWGYRIVKLHKHRWRVSQLIKPGEKTFRSSDISWWEITSIKTRGGSYQQLQIRTQGGDSVKLSPQEHTEYHRILKYLQKKCPGKRQEGS